MAADLLTTIRAEIDARLGELRPLLAEYERLTSATDALSAEGSAPSDSPGPSGARPSGARSSGARLSGARLSGARPSGAVSRPRKAAKKTVRPKAARPARGRPSRASIDPVGQAILAALEHGSHTVAELVVVTALPAPGIRDSLRGLRRRQAITKTDRDGKSAYALPGPPRPPNQLPAAP